MAIDYVKEGRIAKFTMNRPERMNGMNMGVMNMGGCRETGFGRF